MPSPDELSPLVQLLLIAALIAVLSLLAHRMKQKAAARRGEPKPPLIRFSLRGAVATIFITLAAILWIAVKVWLQELDESQNLILGILASCVLAGALLYMIWGRNTKEDANAAILADDLGWTANPGFHRRAFTLLPEEQVIREWRGLRVGLSVQDAQPEHAYPGHLRLTVQLAAPSNRGDFRAAFPESALEAVIREARSGLSSLLTHEYDRLELKKSRIVLRLGLKGRKLEHEGKTARLSGLHPVKADFDLIRILNGLAWAKLAAVVRPFVAQGF